MMLILDENTKDFIKVDDPTNRLSRAQIKPDGLARDEGFHERGVSVG
jgi:hypothetical protein